MTEARSGADELMQASTEALWRRIHPVELVRVAVLEAAVAALRDGRLEDGERAVAEREAHKIAGSAGTFGHGRASEIAHELETILAAPGTAAGATARATALVKDLHAALGPTAVPPGAGAAVARESSVPDDRVAVTAGPISGHAPTVLILHPSAELVRAVSEGVRTRGLTPEVASDLHAARSALQSRARPAAAVVHLPTGRDARGTDDLLGDLDRLGTAVVGLLPADAGTASRVAALRAGARLLLDTPLDHAAGAARIADAVTTLLNDPDHSVPRVLAVDDDETVLLAVRQLLDTTAARVETLSETEGFWASLSRFQPDLVLLDVDMPGVSGLELCRLVRSDPRWSQLPVVFLSGSREVEAVARVYAAGADDFVGKPVAGPELQMRIASRLERARLHRLLAEPDPLTGLANRRRLERDLDRLQLLADRYHSDLSLAVVDVDHFKRVNDRYGHTCGDEVLRRLAGHLQAAFRGEDAVARLGGEEFVVAMLGMRREDAVERLSSVLQSFRGTPVEVGHERITVAASAGVAQHRRDGVGFEALYRAADSALRVAKSTGRNRVLPAGARLPLHTEEVRDARFDGDPGSGLADVRHAVGMGNERAEDPDPGERLAFVRAQLRFELGLLHDRVNALVAAEAFLTIAYTAAMSNGARWGAMFSAIVSPILAVLGLLLALLAWPGVATTVRLVLGWTMDQDELLRREIALSAVSGLRGRNANRDQRRSMLFFRAVPGLFALVWGVLTVVALLLTV